VPVRSAELAWQSFERDVAIESFIARKKHHPHATGADLLDDAVMAKQLADGGSGDRHSPDTRLANCKGQRGAG
jgi:hypothetical protein